MKQITVTLNQNSINRAIKECDKFQKWLAKQVPKFLEEIAKLGLQIANVRFANAQYDGDNDVKCTIEKRGENCVAIVATGNATLFIEFGTGITYPDNHPEKPSEIAGRGEYGYGLGKMQKGWRYQGNKGTNGVVIPKGKPHAGEVWTLGNPANMPMYFTVSQLQQEFERIARKILVYK